MASLSCRFKTWPSPSVTVHAEPHGGARPLYAAACPGRGRMTLEFQHMASYLILYSRHHLCEDLLHMASYLILYSRHHLCEDLLHQVILCVGYFTVLHPDNQVVLQQLCFLPFQ
ncbi:hypothetical protein ACOMHN_042364 [Nucella lapillus]